MLNSTVINSNMDEFLSLFPNLPLISSLFVDSTHNVFPLFNCLKTNPVRNLFGATILLQVRRALAKPQRRYINNKQLTLEKTRVWQAESASHSTLDLSQTIQTRRTRLCLSNIRDGSECFSHPCRGDVNSGRAEMQVLLSRPFGDLSHYCDVIRAAHVAQDGR